MKKICFIAFSFIMVMVTTGFHKAEKTDDKPGFTITVNGDQFNNQTFFIPPTGANYANLYFDFKEDARAKRTVLVGFKPDNSLQLLIDVPIHKTPGSYTFVEDNIPVYMGFQLTYEKDGSSATYMPGNITVSITKYGKVGEFIEGNFSGELQPRVGGKKSITVSGTFKVKRIKDKI
jgi:hypothetical protein